MDQDNVISTLNNLIGKYLKAEQLQLAREMFTYHMHHRAQPTRRADDRERKPPVRRAA